LTKENPPRKDLFPQRNMNVKEFIKENGPVLEHAVGRFPSVKVLVIGDLIMDEYLWGDVSRISPEAPVPVVQVERETKMVGGAANVAHNMATLGAKPFVCGVTGDDAHGNEIIRILKELGLSTEGIIVEESRPTTIKTRVVAHHQQVVRYDRESAKPISPLSAERILDFIEHHLPALQVMVVSDYGKGVITTELMSRLRGVLEKEDGGTCVVAVDPKTGNFPCYRGAHIITPNHHEASDFCGFRIVDEETLMRAGAHMIEALGCHSVLITQGKDGMTLFEEGGEPVHIPTVAKKVFDVTGAGDTVIGTLALALGAGLDLKTAAYLSNCAAGIVVGEVGTSAVRAEDLKRIVR
jgi:D-beta-D-heptose 7-phosphate kinase/D-beta-D-heptose 1-phosphate adenosyltransferase